MARPTDPRLRALSDQLIGRRPIPLVPAAARGKVAALCEGRPESELLLDALGLTARAPKTPAAPARTPGRRGPTRRSSTP